MQIKELIAEVLEALKFHSIKMDTGNALIDFESELALEKLKQLLSHYAQSEAECTAEALGPICNYLQRRWEAIAATDAMYLHHPQTRINHACLTLANELAKCLKKSPYELLMPGVQFDQTIFSLKLHEFILADDRLHPIVVSDCLDAACESGCVLHYTHDKKTKLKETEKQRIVRHSQEAYQYMFNIVMHHNQDDDDASNLCRARLAFKQAIRGNHYKVTASFGDVGKKQLINVILSQMTTQYELFALMRKMSSNEWKYFLTEIKTPELTQLLLEGSVFGEVLQKYKSNDDATQDKIFFMAMTELYWRYRDGGEQFNSTSGRLASYCNGLLGKTWLPVSAKEDKEMAVSVLQSFMTSEHALDQLTSFITQFAVKNSVDINKLNVTLKWGTMGLLYRQIEKAGQVYQERALDQNARSYFR